MYLCAHFRLCVCVTFLVHSVMTCVLGVLKCRLRTTTQFNTTTVTNTMMNIRYLKHNKQRETVLSAL